MLLPARGQQRRRFWKDQIAYYVGSQINKIPEFCRALDGGEYGAQCATEVKQSPHGKCRVMWLLGWEAPGEILSIINMLNNALEQVEDTVSELCGKSTDCECEKIYIDFMDKKLSGLHKDR